MMADALHAKLDDVRYDAEFAVATEDLDLGYMTIDKGGICGLKGQWSGIIGGRSVIELGLLWRLGYAMEPDWPVEDGYVIEVDGEPSVRARYEIVYPQSLTDFGITTANPAVHAIPAVVAARPGIVTAADLPIVVAAGAVRGLADAR
jgi:hypothetical protein